MDKSTIISIKFSNGQLLEAYFDADGLTFEEEAKQAATGLDSMKLHLDSPKIGEREAAMRAEFEKTATATARFSSSAIQAVDHLASDMESLVKPQA